MNKLFALAAVLALGVAGRILPIEDEPAVAGKPPLAAPASPAASDAAMAQWRARPETGRREALPPGPPPRPAAASLDPREMP